jgi:biotin synthase
MPHIPLSLALPPLSENQFQTLYNHGVDRVAISLDAITPILFENIKGRKNNGPFTWFQHMHALEIAQSVFGPNRTTTHLIIGLGETEEQTVHLFENLVNKDITIGLFPFTPVIGTSLENHIRPSLKHYRRIQLAHHLIQNNIVTASNISFNASHQITSYGLSKERLSDVIARGKAFQTSGCPSCNRPFFTEQPGGPLYNYPLPPTREALNEIESQLTGVL